MLKSMLLILSTSYFAWYMERFEISMIYPFDSTYATPEVAGEPRMSETRFATGDGEELVVWRAGAEPDKPTILYLPGNAGGLKDRADRFARLIDRGYGVTAMAYRGSSGSTGQPDEAVLTKDATDLARTETGAPLILYGESLGTAVAIKLAAAGFGDGVVLEAPFTSIIALIASQYPNETLGHLVTQRWNSLESVSSLEQPLLIVHGQDDKLVPVWMGRMIYDAAASPDKEFLEIVDRGHSDLWTVETQSALFRFLDSR